MSTKRDVQDDSADVPTVVPLRKLQQDGCQYSRPPEIEAAILGLSRITKEKFIDRVLSNGSDDVIPSDCLLYFLRRPPFGNDNDVLFALFTAIRQRVLKAVPVPVRRIPGESKLAENCMDMDIRDAVLEKFQEMLCKDRREYLERLDFFECRFNAGIARLRSTARRDIRNDSAPLVPLAYDSETNEPTPEIESALSCMMDSFDGPKTDFLYRSKIHAAISSLPLEERRIVELFLKDIPFDSKEPDRMTMVKILGCSEKTVRNRRDRAFSKLAKLLKEESAL